MPHIQLSTTSDLDENARIPEILQSLIETMSQLDSIDPKALRAYHCLIPVWQMGSMEEQGFAHCTVSVLEGRSPEVMSSIADAIFAAMKSGFSHSLAEKTVYLSLDIREMSKTTYRR